LRFEIGEHHGRRCAARVWPEAALETRK
jgi:hypothetical protein